jgi:redox-sensitive bicupin YhaK (pirin superfamily)
MNFGTLRVLNDDTVAAGRGFGTHPHRNMEIISIPLQGDLKHMDDMGNATVIKQGDIQVMSAGTGVAHSEYNNNRDSEVKFLQIWVIPKTQNVQPRYDQVQLEKLAQDSDFYQILSPNKDDQGVWIHQDAWFHIGEFKEEKSTVYSIKKEGNGAYLFVLDGEAAVNGQNLLQRDGFGIWDTSNFEINAKKNSRILVMEVPMHF